MWCSITKFLFGLFSDDLDALPSFIKSHPDSCESCRKLLDADKQIIAKLENSSEIAERKTPLFLTEKIVSAVRKERNRKAAQPERHWLGSLSLVGGICLLFLAIGLFSYQKHVQTENKKYAAKQIAAFTQTIFSPLEGQGQADTFRTSTIVDAPIKNEFTNLEEDFYAVGNFIINAFPGIEEEKTGQQNK
ncbi:MAG: hypothetical protein ACYTFY_13035 [Planctomycetota bacterium]|jgi:hypothetical protein